MLYIRYKSEKFRYFPLLYAEEPVRCPWMLSCLKYTGKLCQCLLSPVFIDIIIEAHGTNIHILLI